MKRLILSSTIVLILLPLLIILACTDSVQIIEIPKEEEHGDDKAQVLNKIYVTNAGEDTVMVIDPAPNEFIADIEVGHEPHDIVCTPDHEFVYVANEDDESPNPSITVIHTEHDEIETTIDIPYLAGMDPDAKGRSQPHHIAVTPDGNMIIVSTSANQSVNLIHTDENVVSDEIFTSDTPYRTEFTKTRPHGIAVIPGFAYINNKSSGDVSVIDLENEELVGEPIPVGNGPHGCEATPDGKWVLVSCQDDGTIVVIDTSTNSVAAAIQITQGGENQDLAISPDGNHAFVTLASSHNVAILGIEDADPGEWEVEGFIPVGFNPFGAVVSPDSSTLYVVNTGSNNISVIDIASRIVTDWITVGEAPTGITYCYHRAESGEEASGGGGHEHG